jgi:hypothetical protein
MTNDEFTRSHEYWRERGLSRRIRTALAFNGVASVEQLRDLGRIAALRIPDLGSAALREIDTKIGWRDTPTELTDFTDLALLAELTRRAKLR